jgi:hypothetical protein
MAKTNQSARETQGTARQGPSPDLFGDQNALKTQGMARQRPSLDLFGNVIKEDKPIITSKPTIWVIPQSIMPEIPLRPFSVTRINPTTVVIWNE